MRLALVLGLAGCWTSPAPTIANKPAPVVESGPPAAFAALVTDGTYKLGEVTCTVAGGPVAGGWSSSVRCTGTPFASRVDHDFAATRAGLWPISLEDPIDTTKLAPDKMWMAADPKIIRRNLVDDPSYPTGHHFNLIPWHGGWCMSERGYGGDESAWELCIDRNRIIGGWSEVPGGPKGTFGDAPDL